MRDFYKNLKQNLEEMSSEDVTISVSRTDLELLLKAYEFLLEERSNNKWITPPKPIMNVLYADSLWMMEERMNKNLSVTAVLKNKIYIKY